MIFGEGVRRRLALLLSAVVGASMAGILPVSAGAWVGGNVHLPPPGPALVAAEAAADFEVREPKYLPEGMQLLLVHYAEPSTDGASSVSLYYSGDDGRAIHIWQTDNQLLAESGKDVMGAGSPEVIRGRPWKSLWLADQQLHVLNRFYPRDGVTLSLDGNIEPGELRRVAASIPPD